MASGALDGLDHHPDDLVAVALQRVSDEIEAALYPSFVVDGRIFARKSGEGELEVAGDEAVEVFGDHRVVLDSCDIEREHRAAVEGLVEVDEASHARRATEQKQLF